MSGAVHILQKDLRRFRAPIVLFAALLLLGFLTDAGWVPLAWPTFAGKLGILIFIFAALLSALVAVEDSSLRRAHYLATLPVMRRHLVGGKLLFLLVVVVVPLVLQEAAHLLRWQVSGGLLLKGVGTRLLLALAIAVGAASIGAMWRSRKTMLVGLVGVILLTVTTLKLGQFWVAGYTTLDVHRYGILQIAGGCALGALVLLPVILNWKGESWRRPVLATVGVSLVSLALLPLVRVDGRQVADADLVAALSERAETTKMYRWSKDPIGDHGVTVWGFAALGPIVKAPYFTLPSGHLLEIELASGRKYERRETNFDGGRQVNSDERIAALAPFYEGGMRSIHREDIGSAPGLGGLPMSSRWMLLMPPS